MSGWMKDLHRSNSVEIEEIKERKNRKAICQIKLNGRKVGCGCLVYDPELSKYCIITGSKAIPDKNLAGDKYHLLFERGSSPDQRDIPLSDIVMKETPTCIFSVSGVVLIFIDSDSSQLHHGRSLFRKKCSVLKHPPKIASRDKEREQFCYVDNKRYTCVETNGMYALQAPDNAESITHGFTSVLLECVDRKKINAVGIISSEQGDISPIWLKSSSIQEMLEEERKKKLEEEEKKKREEEKRKKKEDEEERKKREEEERKKEEEEEKKKREEEEEKKKKKKKKKEEERKKREEEERKKKEEEERKKEEEERKKKEKEERKKKEEEDERKKREEEERKKKEEEEREKEEEEEKKKKEEDKSNIKEEEQKEETNGPPDADKMNSEKSSSLWNLAKRAEDKGFKVSDNLGRGDCMFYALSEQLQLVKRTKLSAAELRKKLVQYLKERPDGTELLNYTHHDNREYPSWSSYLEEMAEDGTWGDHVILSAAANVYSTLICVVDSRPGCEDIIINPVPRVSHSNDVLVLGHVPEKHYVSLLPIPDEERTKKREEDERKKKEEEERKKKEKEEDGRKKIENEERKRMEEEERKKKEEDKRNKTEEETDGPKGSNDKRTHVPLSVQDPPLFTLDTPVQDILHEKPELLKEFQQKMDQDDIWGNGWRRLYQELGLPAGRETEMERGQGGPTFNVVKEWIRKNERHSATVGVLLLACKLCERKDCEYSLENRLRCRLDIVDSPVEVTTRKVELLKEESKKKEEEDKRKKEEEKERKKKEEQETRKKEEDKGNKKREETDGPPGTNDRRAHGRHSVQDPRLFTLDTPVQDILDEKPELFKDFQQKMGQDDIWGNGWRRLYQELGLPAGRETEMERGQEGPTFNVVKEWIRKNERHSATVQVLLLACNRCERKDCKYSLEKCLGCRLDVVDSPAEVTTRNVESSNSGEGKTRVECFGDLNENQASEIARRLRNTHSVTLLRSELQRRLGDNSCALSTQELILKGRNYRIRQFTDLVTSDERQNVIQTLRDVLPTYKGVTGPLHLPLTFIRELQFTPRQTVVKNLSADERVWKTLADKLGMDNLDIRVIDFKKNVLPAEEVLTFWEVKSFSTVGALYNILVELGYPYIADLL